MFVKIMTSRSYISARTVRYEEKTDLPSKQNGELSLPSEYCFVFSLSGTAFELLSESIDGELG